MQDEEKQHINDAQQCRNVDVELVMHTVTTVLEPIVKEQRRAQNFGRIKFYLFIAFFVGVLGINFYAEDLYKRFTLKNDYVALVRLEGEIVPGSAASPEAIIPLLNRAFYDSSAKGVILQINSPGGTPVAAGEIRDRILDLRSEFPDKEFIVVGSDYMTSGAYLIATGGDVLYANQSSLVGSIGVIIRSFGFSEIAQKVGIERRIINAGENKSRYDAFLPTTGSDLEKISKQLDIVHTQFIEQVKESRSDRLRKSDYANLFSGDYWTGSEAFKLGLIDGTMTLSSASQKHFGTTRFRIFAPRKPLLGSLLAPFAKSFAHEFSVSYSSQPRMMLTIQ